MNKEEKDKETEMELDRSPRYAHSRSLVEGFETTFNNMGFAATTIDPYCQRFVDFAAEAPGPLLEVGAAFGLSTIAALSAGAEVIANDLDARHLRILSEHVPDSFHSRLTILHAAAPDLPLNDNTLAGILISRVLHFFDGFRIRQMLYNAYRWLMPGGRLFLVAETPYQRTVESFISTYEKRKAENRYWPGLIHDINSYASNTSGAIPSMVHFLDDQILQRELNRAGFLVKQSELFARTDFPEQYRLDGRESVGLVAIKPLQTFV